MENQPVNDKNTKDTSILYNKNIQGVLVLVLVFLAAFLFTATISTFKESKFVGTDVYPSNTISVTGAGEFFVKPDVAEFTFSVSEDAESSSATQQAVEKKISAIVTALKDQGIKEEDIKTISYDLYPKYEWVMAQECFNYPCNENQEQVGFTLSQSISVSVRDFDKAGDIVALVANNGVTNIGGLIFTVSKKDMGKDEARKQAIQEARTKAETLARDLGVELVRMVGFSEGDEYGYDMMYERATLSADGMGGGTPITTVPAGENKVVSNVTITYEVR